MKKIISVIIAVILSSFCLGFTAFAENSSVVISDDYQKLYLNGASYSRFDASKLEIEYNTINTYIELSEAQQETVKEVALLANEHKNIISADIFFNDGATLTVDFLRDDYLDEYNKIVNNQSEEYIIDFDWPEGNTVKAQRTALFGNRITLYGDELEFCDYYFVSTQNDDGSLTAVTGSLIIVGDEYYYVDHEENNVIIWDSFYPNALTELSAWEITDADLIESFKEAEEKYYSEDLGFLYDDTLTESVSAIFLVCLFAIVPFIILILFLILAIRAKGFYKKLFSNICILSAAELIVFAIITACIIIK